MNRETWKTIHRTQRLMRRYQACEIYADQCRGTSMNLAWFAAMETLETTAQVLRREGIDPDWAEFSGPLTRDRIQEAWHEITPQDVRRLLEGETVKKTHCLTCGA